MNEKCLECKYCEIEESGYFGFIGETCLRCRICEEDTENKNICFCQKESVTDV